MESQAGNVRLPTEVVMNIVYWAIEGAYPDYLRHALLTTKEEDWEYHVNHRGQHVRRGYGICMYKGRGGCHISTRSEHEPRQTIQAWKVLHQETDIVYHEGSLQFVKSVRSLAAVSIQWAQISQHVFEKKIQEIRRTWKDYQKSTAAWGCIGEQTAYDVEWKALFQCSRQLFWLRYTIENRLGHSDTVETAKLKHDLRMKDEKTKYELKMRDKKIKHHLKMKDEKICRLENTIQNMAVTTLKDMETIHELEHRDRSYLREIEKLQKENKKLCTSSRADKRRMQTQGKELSSLKRKAKDEGWYEKPVAPAHPMRLRSGARKL